MKVKELIKELSKLDETLPIKVLANSNTEVDPIIKCAMHTNDNRYPSFYIILPGTL